MTSLSADLLFSYKFVFSLSALYSYLISSQNVLVTQMTCCISLIKTVVLGMTCVVIE